MTGGRGDLSYGVVCELCDGPSCVPCGEKVRFEPGAADLQEPTVIVSELDSHLNYTFTVEARSGVSQFGTGPSTATITTALDYRGELQGLMTSLLKHLIKVKQQRRWIGSIFSTCHSGFYKTLFVILHSDNEQTEVHQ